MGLHPSVIKSNNMDVIEMLVIFFSMKRHHQGVIKNESRVLPKKNN